VRHREHDRVRRQRVVLEPDRRSLDRLHAGTQVHARAEQLEPPRSRVRVELRERDVRVTDVCGVALGEEAHLEDGAGKRERGLGGRQVDRREREQVPEPVDRVRRLVALGQPVSERAAIDVFAVEVEVREPQPGGRRSRALARSQSGEAGKRAAQMERSGQRAATEVEDAPAGADERDREPVLEHDVARDADAGEEVAVGGAAAEEDVLAVVEPEPVTLDREGRAAEPRAGFEERHLRPALGALERSGEAGEPASDHDHASHAPPAVRLRTATQPFSQPASETRSAPSTSAGSRSIRASTRP
jgi:hypothetical protein